MVGYGIVYIQCTGFKGDRIRHPTMCMGVKCMRRIRNSMIPIMAAALAVSALAGQSKSVMAAEVVLESSGSTESVLTEETTAEAVEVSARSGEQEEQANQFEMTLEQVGDRVAHARNVLKTSSYGSNMIPTGVAACPGDQIRIYVEAEEGKPLPKIVFTQQMGSWNKWKQVKDLKRGENVFTVPNLHDSSWSQKVKAGGAIYFENPYTADQQGQAPVVRIEGGEKFPLFHDGDDVEAFRQELLEYKEKMQANPDRYLDIVEIVSDYVILNGNMKSAESCFLNGNGTPQKALDFHKDRLGKLFAFAGISEEGDDIRHTRNHARANMRLMQPYGFAYAAGDHTGFQQGSMTTVFGGSVIGWAEAHEIGHHLDIQGGYIGEVTNNMWANYNRVDLQAEDDRVSGNYPGIFTKQSSDDYMNLVNENRNSDLAMWWQLYLLDANYWANYQRAYREGVAENMGLDRNQRMAVVSSYALGMDVTEHFERYRFINETDAVKVREALQTLNVPQSEENIKPWYQWTKSTKDRTSTFGQTKYHPQITSVKQEGNKLVLTMSIEEGAQRALLGYEVLRDGKVIGFTNGNTFSTTTVQNDGNAHTYQVRAFDLRMNTTDYSTKVSCTLDQAQELSGALAGLSKIETALRSALSAGDVDYRQIGELLIMQPKMEHYAGNDTEKRIVEKVETLLTTNVSERFSVMLHGGDYDSLEELLSKNLVITYSEGEGKPYYTLQGGVIQKCAE